MIKTTISLCAAAIFFMLQFNNSYSQWTVISGISGAGQFASISAADQNTIWIAGGTNGNPKAWVSTNGGTSFTATGTTGLSYELYCVCGRNSSTAYLGDGGGIGGVGGNAQVYKTTDGGTTWSVILSTGGSAGFINGIVFSRTNPQYGVAESDPPSGPGQAYWWQVTTDGGNTWNQVNGPALGSSYASAENTLVCLDNTWFGIGSSSSIGNSGKIIWTTNGGYTFNNSTLALTGTANYVSAFTMNTDKIHGAAALSTSLPNVAITTDGCNSWNIKNVNPGVTGYCFMKWVPGTSYIYLLGGLGSNPARRSSDGGNTWTNMTTQDINSFTSMDLVYDSATGNVYGFTVTNDGSVLRLIENITGISKNGKNIPHEYSLSQNYPNPFNPSTKINFALPKPSYVSLKVYDVLGHEVMTPVNEFKSAGTYTVNVDASGLASGIYLYRITAGDFSEAKKMTLIK
jgi:photosystem II stability/assembly factor-like uncharacterized protein